MALRSCPRRCLSDSGSVPGSDRENRFPREDFDKLRQVGYLAIAVPRQLGARVPRGGRHDR
jgi:hypothetical protein